MIYLYAGEDNYESYINAKKKADELAKQNNGEVEIINADDVSDFHLILQSVEGIGMFSEVKIILAKRALNNKKLLEYITEQYDTLKNYDIVLWQDSKADSKLKLVKVLTKDKNLFNFDLPKEREFVNWIINAAKNHEITLTLPQAKFLYVRLNNDKWEVINELNKISLYLSNQNKKTIDENALNNLMGYNVKGDMWQFLDAVGSRNKKAALIEYKKLTTFENNVQLLIAMLDRELRLISQIKYAQSENKDLKELKMVPFVLQKTIQKASKFTLNELEQFFKKLYEMDSGVKKGQIEENLSLVLFINSL